MAKQISGPNFTVRLENPGEDKATLEEAARATGVEKPSVLIRAFIRALRNKRPEEIRAFLFGS